MSTERARALRNRPTEAERALWKHLRLRQMDGNKFRRQQPLGRYIVDFVCLEKRLIVELDGGQHAVQATADAARTAWLETQGFRMIRFWNQDVLQNMAAVRETIRQALLEERPPHPFPPPQRGEGGGKGGRRREGQPPAKGGGQGGDVISAASNAAYSARSPAKGEGNQGGGGRGGRQE